MTRHRVRFPAGARELLIEQAKNGLRPSICARALGMKLRDFNKAISREGAARDTWQEAKAVERDILIDSLHSKALEGDTKAAQFLLAALHGVTDKAEAPASGVNITFKLPDSLPPEKYIEALKPPEPAPAPALVDTDRYS